MTLIYEDIYSRFLSQISDTKLLQLSNKDAYVVMHDLLYNCLSEPYIRKIFSELALDEVEGKITCSLVNSVDELSDELFLLQVLAKGMVIAWMRQKIDTNLNLAVAIGGKEEKVLKNDYKANISRLDSLENSLKKTIRDYGYNNNSYGEE